MNKNKTSTAVVSSEMVRLRVGQKWMKHGPCDGLRVKKIMLSGTPDDDGALSGVAFDALKRRGKSKKETGWFVPGKRENQIIEWLTKTGRTVAA
jgi:hypothetical protein